jgi:hypothetical protein
VYKQHILDNRPKTPKLSIHSNTTMLIAHNKERPVQMRKFNSIASKRINDDLPMDGNIFPLGEQENDPLQ